MICLFSCQRKSTRSDTVFMHFLWELVSFHVTLLGFAEIEVDFRSLSRQDIQLLVGYGCPSTDKKVVFSAKLLRKHVHLDEGDVSLLP